MPSIRFLITSNLLRGSTHHYQIYQTSFVRVLSRSLSNYSQDEQTTQQIPSFSTKSGKRPGTNFDGFNPEPPISVYTNIMTKKVPNYNNLPQNILDKLNQQADVLLQGAHFAIEAVTKGISSQRLDIPNNQATDDTADAETTLQDCLTADCHYRLRNCYLSMNELRERHFFVNTPKEDIFFSWIHSLDVDEFGSTLMNVSTMSFPQYGFLSEKRKEADEKRSALYNEIRNIQTNEEKEKLKKKVDDLMTGMKSNDFEDRDFLRGKEIVVSNFIFKIGPDPGDSWLMDEIMMRKATEIYSHVKVLRWKGRMALSLIGFKWRTLFIIDMLYAGMFSAFVGTFFDKK